MKIGIIGSGFIVKDYLEMQKTLPQIENVAICVREKSVDTGKKLAEEYHIPKIYTMFEEMLADPNVEFVYIGVTSSFHYEYVKKALEAGKHVINEKPFTITLEEDKELTELAREKKLYLLEAITNMYMPGYQYIKENLPLLGKIRMIQTNYSQYSSRYDKYLQGIVLPAFDPKLAGGALYDINIYNIHFVVGLMGIPKEVSYIANIGFNGIDTSGIVTMKYEECVAHCCGAKDTASPGYAIIQGEKGYIRVNGIPSVCEEVEICTKEKTEKVALRTATHRMTEEWIAFEEIYREGDYDKCLKMMKHSENVMEVTEKARIDAGIFFR